MNIGFNKGFSSFLGAKEPLEVMFSPKKKNKELIFKFKKFSSILCHLQYYSRKRENEHVCTYIYTHGAWALAANVAPRDTQKQHSKSHSNSILISISVEDM